MLLKPPSVAIFSLADPPARGTISLDNSTGKSFLLALFLYASSRKRSLCLVDLRRELQHHWENQGSERRASFHSSRRHPRAAAAHGESPLHPVAMQTRSACLAYHAENSWLHVLLGTQRTRLDSGLFRSPRHGLYCGVVLQSAQMPADFPIDSEGSVLQAHYDTDTGDHPPVEPIDTHPNIVPPAGAW